MQVLRRIVSVHQFISRQLCPVSRVLHTSTLNCKIFEVPAQTKADDLKQQYPNPRRLVEGLLEPLVGCGVAEVPGTEVVARLAGRYWRASLLLPWPTKVTVTAVHSNRPGAEENVYLLACHLLKTMGLLYQSSSGGGVTPVTASHVKKILRDLHSSFRHPFRPSFPAFHFDTVPLTSSSQLSLPLSADVYGGGGDCTAGMVPGKKGVWVTEVSASWPYVFSLRAVGPSCQASKYAAALYTSIKLKSLGLLCQDNDRVSTSTLETLSRPQRPSEVSSSFHPHFELYTDASACGYGAYLLSGEDDERKIIHWLANTWGDEEQAALTDTDHPLTPTKSKPGSKSALPGMDITFCELYAVVSALFTWKHRLEGSRVLVWTDNMAVVGLVNTGLRGNEDKVRRWGKLCSILEDTRRRHSIEVLSCHVKRQNNRAADMLSRYQLTDFKQAVPEASSFNMKTEKLPSVPGVTLSKMKTVKVLVVPEVPSSKIQIKKLPFVSEATSCKIKTKEVPSFPEVRSSKVETENLLLHSKPLEPKKVDPSHCST